LARRQSSDVTGADLAANPSLLPLSTGAYTLVDNYAGL